MNAQSLTIDTDQRLAETSWPNRWDACKGTDAETACLLSIAAETEKAGENELHMCAYDAAHSREDRADRIADMEAIFADWAEDEIAADRASLREAWGRERWNNHVTFGMVS